MICCTVAVAQMYYEAKSINTHLIYKYKQLEKEKEALEAAWSEHKRLHRDAGLDLSECCRAIQTCDVSSSVPRPVDIRERSQSCLLYTSDAADE